MRQFFKALILLPIAVVVVLLAVANRAPVLVSLDPFSRGAPEISFTWPLYAVVFGAVMLGVVIGGIGAWLAQGKNRRARRESRREVHQLRTEVERARARPAQGGPPAHGGLPAQGGASAQGRVPAQGGFPAQGGLPALSLSPSGSARL